ncbi:DUF3558 domain-containing protein [Streptomyces sp. NPDC052095]|uniref:DUF3558 domain-containing protein n=1 Tax=unclassified Streptomyces TaxID=2593676 RepID=UPI00344E61A5
MAFATGTALLAALVVGCSADSGTDGSAADGKSGETTVAAAAPGKYRTLPEACGSVTMSALKDLLPGTADLPEDQQKKVYAGTAAVTYNTERRVGCSWKSDTSTASHTLTIDFERVVSYDPAVSDDDRALEVYTKKETAAGLSPASSASPDGAGSGDKGDGTKETGKKGAKSGAKDSEAEDSGTGSGPSSHALATSATASADPDSTATDGPDPDPSETDGTDTDLRPRLLDGLGDSAFLNDRLTHSGSAAQHRTVSVVFRTSNVVVTIEYTEQPTASTAVPDSGELQEKAQALARNLVEKFSE